MLQTATRSVNNEKFHNHKIKLHFSDGCNEKGGVKTDHACSVCWSGAGQATEQGYLLLTERLKEGVCRKIHTIFE